MTNPFVLMKKEKAVIVFPNRDSIMKFLPHLDKDSRFRGVNVFYVSKGDTIKDLVKDLKGFKIWE